jgi:hypothetical protein
MRPNDWGAPGLLGGDDAQFVAQLVEVGAHPGEVGPASRQLRAESDCLK